MHVETQTKTHNVRLANIIVTAPLIEDDVVLLSSLAGPILCL